MHLYTLNCVFMTLLQDRLSLLFVRASVTARRRKLLESPCQSQIPISRRAGVYIQLEPSMGLYVVSCHRLTKSPVRVMRSRLQCLVSESRVSMRVWKWMEKVNAAEWSSSQTARCHSEWECVESTGENKAVQLHREASISNSREHN